MNCLITITRLSAAHSQKAPFASVLKKNLQSFHFVPTNSLSVTSPLSSLTERKIKMVRFFAIFGFSILTDLLLARKTQRRRKSNNISSYTRSRLESFGDQRCHIQGILVQRLQSGKSLLNCMFKHILKSINDMQLSLFLFHLTNKYLLVLFI